MNQLTPEQIEELQDDVLSLAEKIQKHRDASPKDNQKCQAAKELRAAMYSFLKNISEIAK
jgi:hypothetical protein